MKYRVKAKIKSRTDRDMLCEVSFTATCYLLYVHQTVLDLHYCNLCNLLIMSIPCYVRSCVIKKKVSTYSAPTDTAF